MIKTEPVIVSAFRIDNAPGLDPILVIFQDLKPGQGRVIIQCYGQAWTGYWCAMGDRLVRDFVTQVDVDYLACKLVPFGTKVTKRAEEYLFRVTCAVHTALNKAAAP